MAIGTKMVDWLEMRVARALATRAATPLILVGTMAAAGIGAAATNPTQVHQAPNPAVQASYLILNAPRTFCMPDPDGDGFTVCHVLASQVSAAPHLGSCHSDSDHDGTFVCYYATDPTAGN